MGRRIRVDDPFGQTKFEHDNWNNLIALTDAKNQRTEFEYDDLGRLKKEIRLMSEETSYEYYPAGSGQDSGRLWKIIDAKLQVTEYGYDAQGRVETISYAGGKTVTLTYDADSNLSGYSDGGTLAEYDYDDLGRKIWERVDYGDFSKEFSHTYYRNGLKKTFTAPDGTMYEYTYGSNNELREVRIPGLGAMTIPDYTWNRSARMTFPGGSQRVYGYDGLMRLKTLTATDPGGNPLLDCAYTYNNIGNIVTKATEHGTYTYDYDASSRLTSADNPVLDDESYTYDNVGNRLTAADVSGTWSYNANNELLGFADIVYDYDADGNMIQIKVAGEVVWTYGYDAADRLVHVEDTFLAGQGDQIAQHGVLVRHLILPGQVQNSLDTLSMLFLEFGKDLPVSLMSQYHLVVNRCVFPNFQRHITEDEFRQVYDHALSLGLQNLFIQYPEVSDNQEPEFLPDFTRKHPFKGNVKTELKESTA